MKATSDTRDVVLITGAGSGLGMESALLLAERNYRVFGGVLTEPERTHLLEEAARRRVHICAVPLDVTSTASIRTQVDEIIREAGRIDILIHFAGMGLRGFMEDLMMDEIRRVYDVNVFGIMELTQAVLPHMREQRKGRIVITSSAAGRMGSMSIGGYSSSKFAVEGFAECLAQEVFPFGIFVSLLEPGLIQTPHFSVNRNRGRRAKDPSSPYYLWFCQHEHIVDGILSRSQFTTRDVAKKIHQIVTDRRPRLRYVIGRQARSILALRRYVPGFERFYWAMVRRLVTSPREQVTKLSGE